MMFRNSFRLLFSNFSLFWKELLYRIIVLGICLLLLLPLLKNFLSLGSTQIFFENAKNLFLHFPFNSLKDYFAYVWQTLQSLFSCISELFDSNAFGVVYLFFVLFFLCPFLISMGDIAVGEVLYCSMSSLSKVSYTGMYVRKIGKSLLYSLFKTMLSLPFVALTLCSLYGFLYLSMINDVWLIFAPMLMIVSFILIMGLDICLTSGFMPALVVYNCKAKNAFAKGIKAVGRRFFRCLSTITMMLLLLLSIGLLFGVLSTFVLMPLGYMLILIFRMVMFFGSQGMNYYVDLDTILKPKKLEETDRMKKAIDLI